LRERALLRPRTAELSEGLLRLHILPTLGPVTPANLKPPMIRTWHAGLLSSPRPGATTGAKSYRLLQTILATAVDDDVLEKNPCRIRGAGVEHSKERPIATIEQVYALTDAIDPMYRVLVLTATFTSLRLGEPRALTRKHLNLLHAWSWLTEQHFGRSTQPDVECCDRCDDHDRDKYYECRVPPTEERVR
jgi:integrase